MPHPALPPAHTERPRSPRRLVPVPFTEHHLLKGRRGSCYGCAVALALNDATGYTWHVTADLATCEVPALGAWPLPPEVQTLIHELDQGRLVPDTIFALPARFAPKEKKA